MEPSQGQPSLKIAKGQLHDSGLEAIAEVAIDSDVIGVVNVQARLHAISAQLAQISSAKALKLLEPQVVYLKEELPRVRATLEARRATAWKEQEKHNGTRNPEK